MTMLNFDKAGGLVSAIAQDAATGEVLMIAWMNQEAFEETIRTGRAVYFSRSRNKLWRKGEESGNVPEVKEVFIDCAADAVLLCLRAFGAWRDRSANRKSCAQAAAGARAAAAKPGSEPAANA